MMLLLLLLLTYNVISSDCTVQKQNKNIVSHKVYVEHELLRTDKDNAEYGLWNVMGLSSVWM